MALGKRYLFGGAGLPKSSATALYWLDRAAQQHEQDAWILIGSHISFETAQRAAQPANLCHWYERAFDAGVVQAGLALAQLVLAKGVAVEESMRNKALLALKASAHAGLAEAQWLLAQHLERIQAEVMPGLAVQQDEALELCAEPGEATLEWTIRAAKGGVAKAQRAMASHAWDAADYVKYLRWSLPLARHIELHVPVSHDSNVKLSDEDVTLLSRCAHALALHADSDTKEIERFLELAAQAGDRKAQFSLGLRLARMDSTGARVTTISGSAQYKKAIRWLTLSGEQGLAEAWYAMSRIYLKPEFSQRNLADAQQYLEKAATAGHSGAQLELGITAWRTRRETPSNDIRAVYWLQKAAAQNNPGAENLLEKIAERAQCAEWAQAAKRKVTRDVISVYPFLAARIELAELIGLSRAEALLIDMNSADYGHCLLVDIRAQHPRSKRRLILIQTGEQRQALTRIARIFENIDCGPEGPEGNYRQRLYRFRCLIPD
ncbi:MAG: tetratricopeptide repeat protein [Pseudomonadota bacterium]